MPPGSRTSGSSPGPSAAIRSGGRGIVGVLGIAPGVGQPVAPGEVDHVPRLLRRPGTDDLDPDPLHLLEGLTARHERGHQEIAQRAVVEHDPAQHVAIHRDVAHRPRDDRGQVRGLARQEVHLAQKARLAMPDDLASVSVLNHRLALDDRDERIPLITDPEQHLANRRGALAAGTRQRLHLRPRQRRARRGRHATRLQSDDSSQPAAARRG